MAKLVLHFDINGTITAIDSTELGSDYQNTNMIISRSVYGKIKDDQWISNDHYRDPIDSITYYDFLKKSGIKNYKKISYTFTEEGQPGYRFQWMVAIIIESIQKFIFNSFIKVAEKYPDAIIVLRTFGGDIQDVLNSVVLVENDKFKKALTGEIIRNNDNIILKCDHETTYHGLGEINQLYFDTDVHLAIQEDYHFWNGHQRDKNYGKIIKSDEKLIQIFFDDNDCVSIIGDENCHFFKINTLDALMNEDYFINLIMTVIN